MMLAPLRPDAYGSAEDVAAWLETIAAHLRTTYGAHPSAQIHARVEMVVWDRTECELPCPRLAVTRAYPTPAHAPHDPS